jgi:hypothetical protein
LGKLHEFKEFFFREAALLMAPDIEEKRALQSRNNRQLIHMSQVMENILHKIYCDQPNHHRKP